MTCRGSGYAGRRFPAGRVRPGRRSGVSFVFPLAWLLLACMSLPQHVVAEEEQYTLPENDPCSVTFEGYKKFFAQRIDNYFLLKAYQIYATDMEWWRCCPGSEKNAAKFRPKNADEPLPEKVLDIEVPAIFDRDSRCAAEIYYGIGDHWRDDYSKFRENHWNSQYATITKTLQSCCVKHLNACLKEAFNQDTSDAGRQRMNAESDRCLERYSPDYVAKAAVEPVAVPAEAQPGPVGVCESDLARVRKEHDELQQRAQMDQAKVTQLTSEAAAARDESVRNAEGMRAALAQIAPRPGIKLLTGFPSAAGSTVLAVFGIVVLTAGFFLGWPGRSRDARTNAGWVSAVIAFGVFFFSVALLPDTRAVDLLLAVTIAVLVVAVRALVRSQIEVRYSAQTPPPSP